MVNKEKEIEKTMAAFDEVKPGSINPFFFTRVDTKLQESNSVRGISKRLSVSLFFACIVLVLINGWVLFSQNTMSSDIQVNTLVFDDTTYIENLKEVYSLNENYFNEE